MKISFLYSKIVVLKNCVRQFLFISSFRWYGDFFDDCNIFLNRLCELLLIIKISRIRTKPNTILKLTSLAMSWENLHRSTTRLKISNCPKILREKIEFEYYIFNVFLIASEIYFIKELCEFSTFFVQTWSDSRTSLMLSWKPKQNFRQN
jgi:hypothetical protein